MAKMFDIMHNLIAKVWSKCELTFSKPHQKSEDMIFRYEVLIMKRNLAIKFTKLFFDKLNKYEFLTTSRVSTTHFSRNRKLTFVDIMLLIIRGMTKNIQTELREYMFNVLKQEESCSKQAFSKARQHIKPSAFRELFDFSVSTFYQEAEYKTLKGYRVSAVDGSKLNLPNSNELIEKYGVQTSQGEPQAQALLSAMYDVLNNVIMDAELVPCHSYEGKIALKHLDWLSTNSCGKELILFDRGYPSAELIHEIENRNFKYLMRCTSEFAKWLNYQGSDCTIEHKFKKKAISNALKLRVVEVEISSGKEFLITNLTEDEFSAQQLKDLYRMRWGIETEYDNLKNKILLENFSGACDIAILQDLYASLLLSNYAYFFVYDNEEEIANMNLSKDRKFAYKQNINQTILSLRTIIINTIATGSIRKIQKTIKLIEQELRRAVVPVREKRNIPRIKRHKSNKFPLNQR